MSVTTRKGYRKSIIAKRFARDVLKKEGRKINLREARKCTEAIENVLTAVGRLPLKDKIKIVRATALLYDIELPNPRGR
jgi:hypothetical protein